MRSNVRDGTGTTAAASRELTGAAPLASRAPADAPKTLDAVRADWDAAGIKHAISERKGVITLSQIVVPPDARNSGTGTAAMKRLIEYADSTSQTVALTPSADFGGNKTRLTEFYKRFGFVENKGRGRDLDINESMYRPAQDAARSSVQPAATRGSIVEDVERAIAPSRAKWRGFSNVNVVQSAADLPPELTERTTADEGSEGYYDPRTRSVYLIADNLASPERAAWVAAHEVVGHGGLRMLNDKSINDALKLAGANRFVRDLAAAIQRDRGDVPENIALEEAIAELSAATETGDFDALADRYGVQVPAAARSGVRAAWWLGCSTRCAASSPRSWASPWRMCPMPTCAG